MWPFIGKLSVERYYEVVLFVFQFNPVCNFEKLTHFGLGTDRSERVKILVLSV